MAARSDGQLGAIRAGTGRHAVASQPALLISPGRAEGLAGLVLAHECLVLGYPSELTVVDFLASHSRRVGRVHDASELHTELVRSSDCPMATMRMMVGDSSADLARMRAWRSRFLRAEPEIRVRVVKLSMTERAREVAGDRAGLRVLDCRADVDAATLEELERAGRKPGSQLWRELEALRSRHVLAGFLVRSRSTRGTTMILNLHALEVLFEADLMQITIKDELCPREEVFGHTTALDHLQQFIGWLGAWIAEVERLAGQAKRLVLFLFRFAWRAKIAAVGIVAVAVWASRLVL